MYLFHGYEPSSARIRTSSSLYNMLAKIYIKEADKYVIIFECTNKEKKLLDISSWDIKRRSSKQTTNKGKPPKSKIGTNGQKGRIE